MDAYWDYHFPLSVWSLLKGNALLDPSMTVPADSGPREWYSQPRTPGGYTTSERATVTVFDVGPANIVGYTGSEAPSWGLRERATAANLDWKVVPYTATVPMTASWVAGAAALTAMINATAGKFVLTGTGLGAVVVSLVYDQIRGGSLAGRRADLLGGITFGSPVREGGHTWPGGYDPGGRGIQPTHLSDTEDLWWDLANPGDIVTSSPDGRDGEWLAKIVAAMNTVAPTYAAVTAALGPGLPSNIAALFDAAKAAVLSSPSTPAGTYDTLSLPGSNRTAASLAAERIDALALALPVESTSTDSVTEVLTTKFKLPLSVSELSFEVLRVPCDVEVWYQDRSNNWRPALDESRFPVAFGVDGSNVKSWYKYHTSVYPIVAKAVQFRFTRTPNQGAGAQPVVVGMRNGLIRRNVYDRAAGSAYFEDEQDAVGNVISKYVKDWDATKAFDELPNTFWKSAAMPDPQAVVSLYLDVRTQDGSALSFGKMYLDPVYTGQSLNLYYSNDDTVATRKPSPVTAAPSEDVSTEWKPSVGRYDTASTSAYRVPFSLGPLLKKASWIGVEWVPSFKSTSGPANKVVLLGCAQPAGTSQTGWKPSLSYDPGAARFALTFTNGTSTARTYTVALTRSFAAGEPLRVVAGWKYGPDKVYLSVVDSSGAEIAASPREATPTNLPALVTLDGHLEAVDFRGTFRSHVVKVGDDYAAGGSATYQANPPVYVSPEPVTPDAQGRLPETSLDNAVFYSDWTLQEHGCGGSHDSHYEDKEWVPVPRDYLTEKGVLFLPETVSAKYVKLEFSGLTEEPYPVFESGISVQYKVFPVSVSQQSSQGPRLYTGSGGFLGLGTFLSLNGTRTVNWLNPASVVGAVNAAFGKTTDPVMIQAGPGYVTDSLPNTAASPVTSSYRTEAASEYVYRREQLSPYVLAQNATETIIKAEGLSKIADYTDVPWDVIERSNPGAISNKKSAGALPVRGTDWWIFPGQTLKIPAAVMTKLTSTSTVTERKLTSERRVRFDTASVHRYEVRTLKRDAGIAYFAGVREVFPMSATNIAGVDLDEFRFNQYESPPWAFTNVRQLTTGMALNRTEQAAMAVLWASATPKTAQQVRDAMSAAGEVIAYGTAMLVLQGLVGKNIVLRTPTSPDDLYSAIRTAAETLPGPISTPGNPYNVPNGDFSSDLRSWTAVGAWGWDGTQGYAGLSQRGCALITTTGAAESSLTSSPVAAAPLASLVASAWVRWEDATSTTSAKKIRLKVVAYYANGTVKSTYVPTGGLDAVTNPTGNGGMTTRFHLVTGSFSVPSDVYSVAVQVVVDSGIAGKIRVDSAWLYPSATPMAVASKTVTTESKFGKVTLDFRDSGPRRSDAMWAGEDSDQLAYYVEMSSIPPGFWSSQQTTWTGADSAKTSPAPAAITWGSQFPLVSVSVDPDRVYQKKRVLHFRRAAGVTGQAGVRIRQWNNYVGDGQFRIGFVLYKPYDNANSVIVRLRRVSTGVVYYEESVKPPAGRWWEYKTRMSDVPAGADQVYTVELSMSGDAADELYLSDLYTEVTHIRYFVTLGSGGEATQIEVTDLRNADGSATVTSTRPVNQFNIETRILSPKAWAHGVTARPTYLR